MLLIENSVQHNFKMKNVTWIYVILIKFLYKGLILGNKIFFIDMLHASIGIFYAMRKQKKSIITYRKIQVFVSFVFFKQYISFSLYVFIEKYPADD